MVYTTYLSKMKDIPKGATKFLVTRLLPKGFDKDSYGGLIYAPELSPSEQLLFQYKYDEDWNRFRLKFVREMKNRKSTQETLSRIGNMLENNEDIYLICYEKEHEVCHRTLLAQELGKRGFEYREF